MRVGLSSLQFASCIWFSYMPKPYYLIIMLSINCCYSVLCWLLVLISCSWPNIIGVHVVPLLAVCLTSIILRMMLLPLPQGIAVGSVGLIKYRFEFACSLEEFVSTVFSYILFNDLVSLHTLWWAWIFRVIFQVCCLTLSVECVSLPLIMNRLF